jgi:hypothetical protein
VDRAVQLLFLSHFLIDPGDAARMTTHALFSALHIFREKISSAKKNSNERLILVAAGIACYQGSHAEPNCFT